MEKIEMSLDDIIKANRSQKKLAAGRGAPTNNNQKKPAGGRGAPTNRSQKKPTASVSTSTKRRGGRTGGQTQDAKAQGAGGVLKGRNHGGGIVKKAHRTNIGGGVLKSSGGLTKLIVSNLDYGVSDSDIHQLFNECGTLKKSVLHYERSGRSLGTADVVFERRSDALKAIKQYNGITLDGRPMNIQLASSDMAALTPFARLGASADGVGGVGRSPVQRKQGGNAPARRGGGVRNNASAGRSPVQRKPAGDASTKRGAPGGGQRRSGGRNAGAAKRNNPAGGATDGAGSGRRNKRPAPTTEKLDAEMDAYVKDKKTQK